MAPYLSPGVYVEEVPSAVKAIAGVSTSTAGFIGIVPDALVIPVEAVTDRTIGTGDGEGERPSTSQGHHPVLDTPGSFRDQGERRFGHCHACQSNTTTPPRRPSPTRQPMGRGLLLITWSSATSPPRGGGRGEAVHQLQRVQEILRRLFDRRTTIAI